MPRQPVIDLRVRRLDRPEQLARLVDEVGAQVEDAAGERPQAPRVRGSAPGISEQPAVEDRGSKPPARSRRRPLVQSPARAKKSPSMSTVLEHGGGEPALLRLLDQLATSADVAASGLSTTTAVPSRRRAGHHDVPTGSASRPPRRRASPEPTSWSERWDPALADPILLHQPHLVGPLVEGLGRPSSSSSANWVIFRNHWLKFAALHRRARAPALAVDHLLVGEHGDVDRVPIDLALLAGGRGRPPSG